MFFSEGLCYTVFADRLAILKKEIAGTMKLSDLERRRDRFDRVITEHLRSGRKTTEELSEQVGCSLTSLWRYRYTVNGFSKMPINIFAGCARYANISNEDLRFILALPTGLKGNEN